MTRPAAQLPEDILALPLLKAASELEHLANLSKRALRKAESFGPRA
ncbi:hypothetical protein [Thermus thermophilus]|nr:hypothetical protein [Thermus thermophilus]